MNKVFLGGTCNNSGWRDELIPLLDCDYFNPVVDEWTEEAIKEEEKQKKTCNKFLFVITPLMTGFFSIAEVVDYSNKRPNDTILCILNEDIKDGKIVKFNKSQKKSLYQIAKMVYKNGANVCNTLKNAANLLNHYEY